ncbi:hypothetical protein Q0M94_28180 (plasmid) [Deinococcus radiomollis]|uniref:hypothetical protein n=1 Tax=Deinococcus radiomollis TaxID=468916 RepID=UPI0038924F82
MPTRSQSFSTDSDVMQERHRNDPPSKFHPKRDRFVTDRICDYIRMNVPAGQQFTTASLSGVATRRDTISHILGKLHKEGFFTRIAQGVYVHDGRFPVRREVVKSAPRPPRKESGIEKIRAYVSEHFSSGQVFHVNDITVPGFNGAVGSGLAALKRSGYLVSAGYGRYAVWQGEQTVAGLQFLRPLLRVEVLEFADARTFGPGDFQHLGNRKQVGNALETLEREGTVARVGPAQYVKAELRPAQVNVSFSARVLQRIRDLPPGQTFTRSSSVFDDLGTRDTLKSAFEYLLSCREITRVGWGTYLEADDKRLLAPNKILSVKQQTLMQIEAHVPYDEKFTVEVLDIHRSLKALNGALSELSREGIIERVARGVYVRRSFSRQRVKTSGKIG